MNDRQASPILPVGLGRPTAASSAVAGPAVEGDEDDEPVSKCAVAPWIGRLAAVIITGHGGRSLERRRPAGCGRETVLE
jgi:hypothetical protein